MQKRHQILANSLKNTNALDTEPPGSGTRAGVEEISFAHAQRDLRARTAAYQADSRRLQVPLKVQQASSSSPVRESPSRTKRSKLLEKLDVCERELVSPRQYCNLTIRNSI